MNTWECTLLDPVPRDSDWQGYLVHRFVQVILRQVK